MFIYIYIYTNNMYIYKYIYNINVIRTRPLESPSDDLSFVVT